MLLRKRLHGASVPCAAALLFAGAPCLAQTPPPSAADIANARALGVEGVQAADRGDCTTAIDRLWRAEQLYHAPTLLERLGECQVNLGKLVAGTETLQRVVREPIGPSSPAAFVAAHDRAQKVLDAALPRIGKLVIHVNNGQVPGLAVSVDGESVPVAGLDVERPVDPGTHQVEASATGFSVERSQVTIADGGSAQVALSLKPTAAQAAPPLPAPVQSAPVPPPNGAWPANAGPAPAKDEGASPSRVGPIVLLAAGGVGLVVGGVFGGLALSKKSSLDSACHPKSNCPASEQSNIDALGTDATISTVGFAVGGAAAVAGLVWLLVGNGSSPAPAATVGNVEMHPFIGPTSAGVSGAF